MRCSLVLGGGKLPVGRCERFVGLRFDSYFSLVFEISVLFFVVDDGHELFDSSVFFVGI